MKKKIGVFRFPESNKLLNYKNVPSDYGGWVNASKFLPSDYDLVYLKVEGKPIMSGWLSMNKWDGLNINPEDKVLYWKKQE